MVIIAATLCSVGWLLPLGSAESQAGSADQLDPTFGKAGRVSTSFGRGDSRVFGIAVDPTGQLIAVGESDRGSHSGIALARYTAAGVLDRRFGVRGKVRTSFSAANVSATAVAIQRNGAIVVAGPKESARKPVLRIVLARYRRNGTLDPSFGHKGEAIAPFEGRPIGVFLGAAVAQQPNGKIIVAGTADSTRSGPSRFGIARYNPDGSLDHSFGNAGQVTTAFGSDYAVATSIALQPDRKIVVAGYSFAPGAASTSFALARYNANGSLDQTFGSGGEEITSIGSSSAAAAVAVESNGKIVLAGSTSPQADPQVRNFGLVRYDRNGALDPTFGGGGMVTTAFTNDDGAQGVAIERDGRIVAAGSTVTRKGARFRFALAIYRPDGALDPAFGGGGKVMTGFGVGDDQAHAIAIQRNGKIVVAGESYDQARHAAEFALARYRR